MVRARRTACSPTSSIETGETRFVDMAAAAGVEATATDSSGVCYGDADNDGDYDMYVVADMGASHYFVNNGDGTFSDQSVASGAVTQAGIGGTSCAFGDIDGDGLVDLFVARGWHQADTFACFVDPFGSGIQHNELYRNDGNHQYTDISATSGIFDIGGLPPFAQGAPTITWSVSLVDYDLDGDLDIFTADDQCALPNSKFGGVDRGFLQIFDNDGTGTFTNRTVAAGTDIPSAWMSLEFGDFNHDGYLDFFSPSFGDWGKPFAGAPIEVGDETARWLLGQPDKTFLDPGVGATSSGCPSAGARLPETSTMTATPTSRSTAAWTCGSSSTTRIPAPCSSTTATRTSVSTPTPSPLTTRDATARAWPRATSTRTASPTS